MRFDPLSAKQDLSALTEIVRANGIAFSKVENADLRVSVEDITHIFHFRVHLAMLDSMCSSNPQSRLYKFVL